MKKSIKKLWVEALRSGKYKQGQNCLRDNSKKTPSFCCLGVLCNIHAQENPFIAQAQTDRGTYLGCVSFLPFEVAKWAGFDEKLLDSQVEGYDDEDNEITSADIQLPNSELFKKEYPDVAESISSTGLFTLSNINDAENAKFSFTEIADIIEAQF